MHSLALGPGQGLRSAGEPAGNHDGLPGRDESTWATKIPQLRHPFWDAILVVMDLPTSLVNRFLHWIRGSHAFWMGKDT